MPSIPRSWSVTSLTPARVGTPGATPSSLPPPPPTPANKPTTTTTTPTTNPRRRSSAPPPRDQGDHMTHKATPPSAPHIPDPVAPPTCARLWTVQEVSAFLAVPVATLH